MYIKDDHVISGFSGGNWFVLGGSDMAGFDDPGVYYSDSLFSDERSDTQDVSRTAAQRRFKEFIKTFIDHQNCFCYR